jgi:NAD(P)-dependent dehydrogenase (short-subunit alcohol dehydrogenase family)
VHAICPAGIDTPMVAGARAQQATEHGATFMPPETVADAVADLLARDDAGRVQIVSYDLGVQDVPSPRHET